MKRVAQHIIEEESRKAFANLLPNEWVANDFTKDYGKDIHVEVFSGEQATGKTFIVQIKGSSQKLTQNTIRVPLDRTVLEYYASLSTPVLLVLYSTIHKSCRAVWANALLSSIHWKNNQKAATIALSLANRIDQSFFKGLEKDFENDFPFRVNVQVQAAKLMEKKLCARIIGWLTALYGGGFVIGNPFFPRTLSVLLKEQQDQLHILMTQTEEVIRLRPISTTKDAAFLHKPFVDENEISENEAELVFVLATKFARYRIKSSLRLINHLLSVKSEIVDKSCLYVLGNLGVANHLVHELQELVDTTINQSLPEHFSYINSVYFGLHDYKVKFRDNLTRAIAHFTDPHVLAVLTYNLGNHYRFYGDNQTAAGYYQRCRRIDRSYRLRYYWWHEFAGVLFLTGHFNWAQHAYDRSIALDEKKHFTTFTYALLADAHFQQAHFKTAGQYFSQYVHEVRELKKNPSAFIILKQSVCERLVEQGYSDKPVDQAGAAEKIKEGLRTNERNCFEEALALNSLNGFAWRQLAEYYRQDHDMLSHYAALEMTAFLLETDVPSWFFCLVAAINLQRRDISILLLALCIEKFGEKVINQFTDMILQHVEGTPAEVDEIIGWLQQATQEIGLHYFAQLYVPPRATFRMINNSEFNELYR